ncbi:acyltransferase [[Empedobacter] haloabium]|uniref:Acyltransferase n=1 Tax=[Empedobacter] haloabium TaxID=592317 RepID=A0ABZ1UUB2_9BURK
MSVPGRDRANHFTPLRLLLALLVLLAHAPELVDGDRRREPLTRLFGTLSFGEFAVDCFFLLSGYLIVQSWLAAPHAATYLRKRVLRIYPGFVAASLVCGLVVGPLGADPSAYAAGFWPGGFVTGVALLQTPVVPPVFAGQPHASVNGSMWTISLEFACYLTVLAAGLAGMLRRRHLWLMASVALVAGALAWQLAGRALPDLARLAMCFFCGGSFYLYRERVARWPAGPLTIALVGLALLAALGSRVLAEAALATLGGWLLLRAAYAPAPALAALRRLPDVSYGVYLYGWPVQKLLLWYWPALSPWTLFALAAPLAIALGAASWYLVEKPCLALRDWGWRKTRDSPLF